MSTEEIAKKVVELTRKQAWYEALDTLYDDNIVSVEAFSMGGGSPETRGKQGVRGKVDWWVNTTEVHSFNANGPFVAHDRGEPVGTSIEPRPSRRRLFLPNSR